MTRRAKGRRAGGSRRSTARATPPRVRAAAWLVAVVALILGVGIWLRFAGRAGPAHPSIGAMRDSVASARGRGDWVACLAWAQRLSAANPRDAVALQNLSAAWHNFATVERPTPNGPRPALRNSVERAACEARALTLADSAAAVAVDLGDWVGVQTWRGQMLEYLGLPIDAWNIYEATLQRVPRASVARVRMIWQLAHLRDPQAPDRMQVDPNAPVGP